MASFTGSERSTTDKSWERTYDPICHQVAIPLSIKFNFTNGDNKCSFYIGCTGEYAYTFATTSNYKNMTNPYTLAVEPQIGLNWKYVDWGIFYRKYLKGYNILKSDYDMGDQRGGMFLTFYF